MPPTTSSIRTAARVALLLALCAGCEGSTSRADAPLAAPAAAVRPVTAPAPIIETPRARVTEPTLLMLDAGDRAIVLACAHPTEGLVGPDRCEGIVSGDRTSATGAVHDTLHIGRGATWTACDTEDGAGGFAFLLDHGANGRGPERRSRMPFDVRAFRRGARTDLLGGLMLWPASRRADYHTLAPSTRGAPAIDLARAVALIAPNGIEAAIGAPDGDVAQRPPRVVERWDVDLDGDGTLDVLFHVDGAPRVDLAPRGLVASLSSQRGELALIAQTYLAAWWPMGTVDLDRDSRPEIVIAFEGPESTGIDVIASAGGAWARVGGLVCGS